MDTSRVLQIVGDRDAGFILCLIVIVNLALGSLVMNMHPDLYPPFFPFDLNFFFKPVMGTHWWLYTLLVTFSLFGINMIACFLESIVRLFNTNTGRLRLFAGLLFHAAVILTMAAHIYDGFYGSSSHAMIMPYTDTTIEGIGDVRTKSVNSTIHPDGSLKDTEAILQIQLADGSTVEKTIAYNQPALFNAGQREIIIQGGQNQPTGIMLAQKSDGREFPMMPYQPQQLPGGQLTLQGIFETKMGILIAQFVWERMSKEPQLLTMTLHHRMSRHNNIKVAGRIYDYEEMIDAPVVTAMIRYNPAIPIILISLLVATIGTVLLIRYARSQSQRSSAIN